MHHWGRTLQRETAATQQGKEARQSAVAVSLGRGRSPCCTPRSGVEALLSPQINSQMSGGVTCSGGKLGIRLWIMLRDEINYQELCRGCKQQSGAACAQKRAKVRTVTGRLIRLLA